MGRMYSMCRNRSYRRRVREHTIKRKEGLVKVHFASLYGNRYRGRFSKWKIHCSCSLCQVKSTRCFGRTSNSKTLYSASDLRKMDALQYSMHLNVEKDSA